MPKTLTIKDYHRKHPPQEWDTAPRVRIRLKPENRRSRRQYYAKNSDGMHWTEFREIAEDFSVSLANQLARRIAQTHANLRDRIEIVPI